MHGMNGVKEEIVQKRLFFFLIFSIEGATRVILPRVWIGGTVIYTQSF